MKKILLFPGAFNPPHYGHVEIIETALRNISFDELWIMPSGKREDKIITTSYQDRLALGHLFVNYLKSKVNIPITLITNELDGIDTRFTHEIIKEIKSQPNTEITQLIGLDGFLNIQDKITDPDEKFIIVERHGYELPKNTPLEKNIIIYRNEERSISSTQIRTMIKNHDLEYKNLVPETITTYIEQHRLYLQT